MEKCQGCGVGDTDTAVTLVELTEWLWIYTVPPHPLPGELSPVLLRFPCPADASQCNSAHGGTPCVPRKGFSVLFTWKKCSGIAPILELTGPMSSVHDSSFLSGRISKSEEGEAAGFVGKGQEGCSDRLLWKRLAWRELS